MRFIDAYLRSYFITPENEPEFFSIVKDVYYTPELQSQRKFIQHSDVDRLQHMKSVAFISYLYCKEHELDFRSVAHAAIMHDLTYYDWHVADDGSHRLSGYRHPGWALKNALDLTSLNAIEIDIIYRHMFPLTPTPPKYKESLIVSMVDKYCALQEIRKIHHRAFDGE